MTRIRPSSRRPLSSLARLACALAVLATFSAWPAAQAPAKKPLTVDDYTKWRSIAGQAISGDGKVGDLHAAADEHGRGRVETGAALEEPGH
jgi:hypothetical protein